MQYQRRSIHGAESEENIWGIHPIQDVPGKVRLRQQQRQKDGSLKAKPGAEMAKKLAGLNPENGIGKLKAVKGVLVIAKNYGLALYPNRPKKEPPFEIIPFFRVRQQIADLPRDHRGRRPEILRTGQLIRTASGDFAGRSWKVISVGADGRIKFFEPDRARQIDAPENYQKAQIGSLLKQGLEILRPGLCGVAAVQMASEH